MTATGKVTVTGNVPVPGAGMQTRMRRRFVTPMFTALDATLTAVEHHER